MKLFHRLCFILLLLSSYKASAQSESPANEGIEGIKGTPINDSTVVYTYVGEWPSFPGGNQARNKFLADNINYPRAAEKKGIEGRVIIAFIIEKDGTITNVELLKGVEASLDEEAMRVVKLMPRWNPGKNNGEPVRTKHKVDVVYKLESRKSSSK